MKRSMRKSKGTLSRFLFSKVSPAWNQDLQPQILAILVLGRGAAKAFGREAEGCSDGGLQDAADALHHGPPQPEGQVREVRLFRRVPVEPTRLQAWRQQGSDIRRFVFLAVSPRSQFCSRQVSSSFFTKTDQNIWGQLPSYHNSVRSEDIWVILKSKPLTISLVIPFWAPESVLHFFGIWR